MAQVTSHEKLLAGTFVSFRSPSETSSQTGRTLPFAGIALGFPRSCIIRFGKEYRTAGVQTWKIVEASRVHVLYAPHAPLHTNLPDPYRSNPLPEQCFLFLFVPSRLSLSHDRCARVVWQNACHIRRLKNNRRLHPCVEVNVWMVRVLRIICLEANENFRKRMNGQMLAWKIILSEEY